MITWNVESNLSFTCFRAAGSGISEADSSFAAGPPQVTAIVASSKGFSCSCGPGSVFVFEKTDDKDFFKKTREIKV